MLCVAITFPGAVEYGRSLGMQLGLSTAPAGTAVPPLQMQALVPGNQQPTGESASPQAAATQQQVPEVQAVNCSNRGHDAEPKPPAVNQGSVHAGANDDHAGVHATSSSAKRDTEWHSVPSRSASVPVGGSTRGVQGAGLSMSTTPQESQPVASGSNSSSHGLSMKGLRRAAMGAARNTLKGVKGAVRAATASSGSAGGAVSDAGLKSVRHVGKRGSESWGGVEEGEPYPQVEGSTPVRNEQQLVEEDTWAEVPGAGRHKSKTD